jgi:hypothetical protein
MGRPRVIRQMRAFIDERIDGGSRERLPVEGVSPAVPNARMPRARGGPAFFQYC